MTPRTVGNYRLVEKLGEGGMGTVYLGVDVMLERKVAIKMLLPEIASQRDIVERFRAEAVTLARLNHPSVATLFNFFREGNQYFMVMEYVPGRTLETVIRETGALSVDRTVAVMCKVLDGIEHAHELGVQHRDLKPANIMLLDSGGVKVMDFGIARLLGAARMTRSGRIVGTLEYLAPERVRGQEGDVRSDLYSLGIVLYEMLTGRLPFTSDSDYDLMRDQLEAPPPRLEALGARVPPAIDAAVMRALAKNPDERFPNAVEFRAALEGVPLPARAPVAQTLKTTRLATAGVNETRGVARAGSGGVSGVAATVRARVGRLSWMHAVAGGLVLMLAALVSTILMMQKPAPTTAVAPPPVSAPVTANPPASGAGAPLPEATAEPPKQGAEEVKSAEGNPSLTLGARIGAVGEAAKPAVSKPRADRPSGRPQEASIPPGAPLSLAEILTLLHAGTASARVTQFVELRGAGFVFTPEIESQIGRAGGDRALVAAVSRHSAPPPTVAVAPAAPVQPAPVQSAPVQAAPVQASVPVQSAESGTIHSPVGAPATAPAAHAPAATTSGGTRVAALAEMRRIFIEPMANDLHRYIGAEIQRQLGGRVQVASSKDQADTIMKGTGELSGAGAITGKVLGVRREQTAYVTITDVTGASVLWSDEAGSRTVLMGIIKKGGPRKLAEHLVGDLRRALR
jgi:tRNA A-37 threonylcarbamoyl transferase component Bud32